jgi:uncharacterized protein YuzE
MRALYDSEAHAMYIHLVDPPYEGPAGADDAGYPVLVEFDPDDRIVGVQILSADDHPDAAVVTALERFGLDVVGILAAHDAALRAPDREVTLTLGESLAA